MKTINKLLGLLLVLGMSSACATYKLPHAFAVRRQALPIRICTYSDTIPQGSIHQGRLFMAMEQWNRAVGTRLFVGGDCTIDSPTPAEGDLIVAHIDYDVGAGLGLENAGRVRGRATTRATGDGGIAAHVWVRDGLELDVELHVWRHELGHVLGLDHRSNDLWSGPSLMRSPSIEPSTGIDGKSIDLVKEIWQIKRRKL